MVEIESPVSHHLIGRGNYDSAIFAGIVQLVERLICNQYVGDSSSSTSSMKINLLLTKLKKCFTIILLIDSTNLKKERGINYESNKLSAARVQNFL